MNLRCLIITFLLLASCKIISAQTESENLADTLILKDITVTAYKDESIKETSLNIYVLDIDSASRYGNYNVTDLMSKIPGVSMLTTGIGISKPVIRGLYGNRIVVLLNGLRFDNQQWQEEHGLGLSDVGLNRIELIRGPISVLYGSEAVGGVINLIENGRPLPNDPKFDYSIKINSNTGGGTNQFGFRTNIKNHWIQVRAAYENNADFSDGRNQRILNSRFDGYVIKLTEGFQHRNWTSTNNFSRSSNRYGFIFNDVYDFIIPDQRWSRSFQTNPAHFVDLSIFSSENKFYLKNGHKIFFNAGYQNNIRKEKEGGGKISLNMHLQTVQYLFKYEHKLNSKNRFIVSNLFSFENNKNFGSRKIVPNATMQETNISLYEESHRSEHLTLENGFGAGYKVVSTKLTKSVNTPEKEIQPFNKLSPYFNLFSGASINPTEEFNVKLNISTGARVPNLAELSSNGLHEGVFTYEIGDPNLKVEQNATFNLQSTYTARQFEIWASAFYNHFRNYVYLAPTKESWFGFPVYRYMQQDADQYGGECAATYHTNFGVDLSANYSGMISQTADGYTTPYTPAQRIVPKISITKSPRSNVQLQSFAEYVIILAQHNVALNELRTPGYELLNAGISLSIKSSKCQHAISISGSNILNRAYYDHLSRFKYFGISNPGRNFTLQYKIQF